MVKKEILNPSRVRCIKGGFSFIPHRFLTGGFLRALSRDELLLYFFLVLAGDRNGLSFYSYDKICTLLKMQLDQYIEARDGLMENDLIAFDGTIYQVLSLPANLIQSAVQKKSSLNSRQPESVGKILSKLVMEADHG